MAMEASRLIDGIVRQTVVLIAALATASGQRTPLSHLADELFSDLVGELKRQGLGNKVIADMFGMGLRTYHRRVTRLSVGRSDSDRSLWTEVLEVLRAEGPALRAELLRRFAREDEAVLRAVLVDLVDSGLVTRIGYGDGTGFETRNGASIRGPAGSDSDGDDALEALVTVCLHQGEGMTLEQLSEQLPGVEPNRLSAAVARLQSAKLVHKHGAQTPDQTPPIYRCQQVVIPLGAKAGWEAAVFDHHQAFVAGLVAKLTAGTRSAQAADDTGGSTYRYDLWRGHPMEEEITDWLRATRKHASTLRARLDEHNVQNPPPPQAERLRVVAYAGQNVIEDGQESSDEP